MNSAYNTEPLTQASSFRSAATLAASRAIDRRRRPLNRLHFRREAGRLNSIALALRPELMEYGISRPKFKIESADRARTSRLYNGILARLNSRKASAIERRLMENAQVFGLCDLSGRWFNLITAL